MIYAVEWSDIGPSPVSVTEVKANARIDSEAEDGLLAGYIEASIDFIERKTSLALRPKTATYTFQEFPGIIPHAPVNSVTSVTYTAQDGTAQTLAPDVYRLVNENGVTRFVTAPEKTLPTVQQGTDIKMVAMVGYSSNLPEGLRFVICSMVATMDVDRMADLSPFAGRLSQYVTVHV